jgi:hypothetical protein
MRPQAAPVTTNMKKQRVMQRIKHCKDIFHLVGVVEETTQSS